MDGHTRTACTVVLTRDAALAALLAGLAPPCDGAAAPPVVRRHDPAALDGLACVARGCEVVFLDADDCDAAALARRLRDEAAGTQLVALCGAGGAGGAQDPACFDAMLRKPVDAAELCVTWAALRQAREVRGERDLARAGLVAGARLAGIGHWDWRSGAPDARWCGEFARLASLPAGSCGGPVALVWDSVHPDDRDRVRAHLEQVVREGAGSIEFRVGQRDGVRRLRQESVVPAGGARVVSAVREIGDDADVQDTIRKLAYFDPLTELPNRSFLSEYLRNVLVHARRHDRRVAILHVDLDGFKRVNDTLGHGAGDRLLQEVAVRLQGCVRDSDCVAREQGGEVWSHGSGADQVARFGADEFIVVLSEVAAGTDPEQVAERILARLREPVSLEAREITVGASIGIAVYPEDASDEDSLLRNSALAMHSAKRRGRNGHQRFSESLLTSSVDRLNLEAQLRNAIDGGGLALHYQPKVEAIGRGLAGAEALLRWDHPQLGMVPPSEFIPVAEETGLILPLGEWVVHEVCAQLAAWSAQGLATVPVSINVSARQLHDHGLVRKIRRELDAVGLGPSALEFEITESILMDDNGSGEERLRELQALGSQVSMDDFGTGYSSLSYLKRLPIDVVKIDRSFVRDILGEEDDQAILRAIITMAHQLRLRIVAEGVESDEQMRLLQEMRCDLIQGYVVSRPLPPAEFARRFLVSRHRLAG